MLPLLITVFDLSASDHGLVSAGDTAQWEWADPGVGPVGLGHAWGTNPDGPTLHDTVDTLEVPLPSLVGLDRPVVKVRHFYDLGLGDVGRVEVDDGSGWTMLQPLSGTPDPAGFVGASNGYVEHAFDLSGLGSDPGFRFVFQADTLLAGDGWYVQRLELWDGDVVGPEVTGLVIPEDTQDLVGPYPLSVAATDDVGVTEVTLRWSTEGGPLVEVPMVPGSGAEWRAAIPAQSKNTVVSWSVLASDGTHHTLWPEVDDTFRVYLAAPTNVAGPDGPHQVAQSALLDWTEPDSPEEVTHYQVFQAGVVSTMLVSAPPATVTLLPGAEQTFSVAAVYGKLGPGDRSEPVTMDVEVPQLLSMIPSRAHQGESVYVRLEGQSLYLQQGRTRLNLGPGISVASLDVYNAHAAVARIDVGANAATGSRDVEVDGTRAPFEFSNRFEVLPGDQAPSIVEVTPASVTQGQQVEISVVSTVDFAAAPTISTGDDLLVSGRIQALGERASFGLAASSTARVGTHSLVLDDGRRRLVVDVEVTEFKVPPRSSCATVPGPAGVLSWLLVALLLRGRETDDGDVA
ncbi:MAG: fibronectin type III domain-containing protein [Myxococcales bacterium]|nr:fibronectin type III domain-containing protein [Myxococcales bacterium]